MNFSSLKYLIAGTVYKNPLIRICEPQYVAGNSLDIFFIVSQREQACGLGIEQFLPLDMDSSALSWRRFALT
jgi:hypothetical protein